MPIEIVALGQMDEIRRGTQICYLCGCRLDNVTALGDKGINDDHIPPKSFYDKPPAIDPWRPSLPVHVVCHEAKNRESENIAILLHKLMTEGRDVGSLDSRNWGKRIAALQLETKLVIDDTTHESIGTVKGFNKAHAAAWNWVRGLHLILYGSYLPFRMKNTVHAPIGESYVPDPLTPRRGPRREISADEMEKRKGELIGILDTGTQSGFVDVIRWWGGRCAYAATWIEKKQRNPRCVWALQYEGVAEYADGTRFRSTPWIGWYECIGLPVKATSLTRGLGRKA